MATHDFESFTLDITESSSLDEVVQAMINRAVEDISEIKDAEIEELKEQISELEEQLAEHDTPTG